jgi:hypothetical protein
MTILFSRGMETSQQLAMMTSLPPCVLAATPVLAAVPQGGTGPTGLGANRRGSGPTGLGANDGEAPAERASPRLSPNAFASLLTRVFLAGEWGWGHERARVHLLVSTARRGPGWGHLHPPSHPKSGDPTSLAIELDTD